MIKDIILKREATFCQSGGVLVAGDVGAYRLKMDMGENAEHFTAMAVCQENGQYSANYEASGSVVYCKLVNSMYADEGFITVRLIVSDGTVTITEKEVIFQVVAKNNSQTLATTESSTISQILTAVTDARNAALGKANAATTLSCYGITDAYTKGEVDGKITGVYKCKGTVCNYPSLPVSNQQIGDVYNVTAEYSKTFYGYKVINVCFEGQGLPSEEGYMTLDSVAGFSAGDVITVCDSGKKILGSFTVQSVDGTDKRLGFEHSANSDYWNTLFKIKGNEDEGETTLNTVFFFLGNHITSSTATQASIVKILYSAGGNVVWDGLTWDSLPGIIDFSDYYNKSQIDAKIASAITSALGGAY